MQFKHLVYLYYKVAHLAFDVVYCHSIQYILILHPHSLSISCHPEPIRDPIAISDELELRPREIGEIIVSGWHVNTFQVLLFVSSSPSKLPVHVHVCLLPYVRDIIL